jgi:hypothetical protein
MVADFITVLAMPQTTSPAGARPMLALNQLPLSA